MAKQRNPDPAGFTPVSRDDMTDLALLPNLFRQFVAMYRADFDWLKEMLKAISLDTDSLKRSRERHEELINATARRIDDHEKRLERLEEAIKGQGL